MNWIAYPVTFIMTAIFMCALFALIFNFGTPEINRNMMKWTSIYLGGVIAGIVIAEDD